MKAKGSDDNVGWRYGWKEHRTRQVELELSATVTQRLDALESLLQFAYENGSLTKAAELELKEKRQAFLSLG